MDPSAPSHHLKGNSPSLSFSLCHSLSPTDPSSTATSFFDPSSPTLADDLKTMSSQLETTNYLEIFVEESNLAILRQRLRVRNRLTYFEASKLAILKMPSRHHQFWAWQLIALSAEAANGLHDSRVHKVLLDGCPTIKYARPTATATATATSTSTSLSEPPSESILLKEMDGSILGTTFEGREDQRHVLGFGRLLGEVQTERGLILQKWDDDLRKRQDEIESDMEDEGDEDDEDEEEEDEEEEDGGERDGQATLRSSLQNAGLTPNVGIEVGNSEKSRYLLIDMDVLMTGDGVKTMLSLEIERNKDVTLPMIHLHIYVSLPYFNQTLPFPSLFLPPPPDATISSSSVIDETIVCYQSQLGATLLKDFKKSSKDDKAIRQQILGDILPPKEMIEGEDKGQANFVRVLRISWQLSEGPPGGFRIPFSAFFDEELPPAARDWFADIDWISLATLDLDAHDRWIREQQDCLDRKVAEENLKRRLERRSFEGVGPVLARKIKRLNLREGKESKKSGKEGKKKKEK